ncbi:DUF1501 domain-containing protein, partial [bacterium]|nr:DUF1501 domain-containing protein [bacterium]
DAGYTQTASVLDETHLAWDTHSNALADQSTRFDSLFGDLKIILDEAVSLGIDDQLLVVVKSEFGRDSRVSVNSKDHWPYSSCLIWNKTITGGKTVGLTDEYLRGKKLDPYLQTDTGTNSVLVTHDSIFAALFQSFGVSASLLWGEDLVPTNFIL